MISSHVVLFRLVFRWLAIPWLQAELDSWAHRFNTSPRRADKNKILPQGIPDIIFTKPQTYGHEDFKVNCLHKLLTVILIIHDTGLGSA